MEILEFIEEKVVSFILSIIEKVMEAVILGIFGLVDIINSNDISTKYTLILVVLFTSSVVVLINYISRNKNLFKIKKKHNKKSGNSRKRTLKGSKTVHKSKQSIKNNPKPQGVKKNTTRKKAVR